MNSESLSQQAASRFQLTLLFVDLSHSTEISQAIEPEHYMEVMTQLRAVWRRVVQEHGGYLARIQGDGALIVFGYPRSTEEDGRRAAEAALEIHAQVEQIRHPFLPSKYLPLRMHSGIHSGTVLLSLGDVERGRFDLSGEVPNAAAHLAAAARPGQILASLAVLGPHANYFELASTDWGGKGLPPKDLRWVKGRSQIEYRFEATKKRGLTPLLGRESVVAHIDRFLATDHHASIAKHCLVLVGSAGLGKTRLINETLQRYHGHDRLFLHGTFENQSTTEALRPFAQMVRKYQELQSATSSDVLQTAAHDKSTHGIVGAFVQFFSTIAQRHDLVIVVDDWQWSDDASRRLMGALLALPNAPRILVAARPQEDEAVWIQDAHHISINPLSKEQTALAVKRWLPHADPFLCQNIHTYSGGVPLFIEELCHSASTIDLRKMVSGADITQTWLGSLVAARFARLQPHLQELIRTCAVIGNTVPMWLLEEALGRLPQPQVLIELEDADFLYSAPQTDQTAALQFKHGITREAVYKVIGFKERTDLHQRILDAVIARPSTTAKTDDTTELLAHHSWGAQQWARAAYYAEMSGDKSTVAFAFDLAHTQYKNSLEALDRISEPSREQSLAWCKVAGKLALTSIFDPLCLGNDLSIFEAAVKKATELQDVAVLAQAKYWLGYLQYGLGKLRVSAITVRDAISIASQSSVPGLVAPFEATLGQVLVASSQYDEGLTLLDKALDARKRRPEQLRGISAMGVAYSLAIYGFALADRGQFAQAHQKFDEAIDLLAGTTHPVGNSVRNFICVSYIWQDKWAQAEAIAIESKKIAENSHTLLQLASSRGLLDYIRWSTQQDAGALERFKETLVWMDDHQSSFYTSLYFGFLAHACAQEGQIEQARRYAVRVALRRQEGETLGEATSCRAMAMVAMQQGKPALARRWLTRADSSANARQSERERRLNSALRLQLNVPLG
jgi:tetratricopeptide (TPR) repeat protein